MALPYWSETDLTDRISLEVALSCLDDDNSGTISAGPLDRLQKRCDSRIESALRGNYDLDLVRAAPPNQVVELSLDAAVIELAKRHPEYVRRDWADLDEVLERELDKLRSGKRRLDVVGSPEPASNNGGALIAPGSDTSGGIIVAPAPLVFGGPCGTGDF